MKSHSSSLIVRGLSTLQIVCGLLLLFTLPGLALDPLEEVAQNNTVSLQNYLASPRHLVAQNDQTNSRISSEEADQLLEETIRRRLEAEIRRQRAADQEEVDLTSQDWKSRYRLLLIHADPENEEAQSALERQLNELEEHKGALAARETLMIVLPPDDRNARIGNKPLSAKSAKNLRTRYFPSGRDFDLMVIDKSGNVLLRLVEPTTTAAILSSIDRSPQRQREVQRQLNPAPLAGQRRLDVH